MSQPHRSELARHWNLDPNVVFLNHGSFGACPSPILAYQRALQDELEAEPVRFMVDRLEPLLDSVREDLAEFLHADPRGLVFVENATMGVNTALQALDLRPGDEVVVTDHEYQASRNALDHVASRAGAAVRLAPVPFPLHSEDEVVESILGAVGPATRFALVDHVTSPTGLVLPIERIVGELRGRGVETIVDGAHGPGMLPLHLDRIGAAFYTGNCHKWLCSPKGSAILFVREDWRSRTRPLVISHGASSARADRSRLLLEFDWTGTSDPTAILSIGESLRFFEAVVPGGWIEVQRRNRALALESRRLVCDALDVPVPSPDSMIGTLAAVPLPAMDADPPAPPSYEDPIQIELFRSHRIEVPIVPWPRWPQRLVRTSSQLYNHPSESEYLARALAARLR